MSRRRPDYAIIVCVATLLAIGLVMVFSSSSVRAYVDFGDSYYFLKRQLAWTILGLGAMYVMMRVDYWEVRRHARLLFFISLLACLVVLIPGVGREAGGARRWIGFGSLQFQPSELIKLTIVVYMAWALSRTPERIRDFVRGVLPYVLLAGLVFFLILQQPDLGTAVAITMTVMVMIFLAGARLGHLLGLLAAAVPVVMLAIWSEEYRRRRLLAFLDPFADPHGSGFHIIQSILAIGSGGLFGLGLGRSRQKFFYLPAEHTDFIFAILGEELGFIGGLFVISLFLLLAWRGFRTAMSAPDTFSSLLAAGVTTLIVMQALLNIGVVSGILPITGIPLPFVSFGGSSLVFTMAGVGMLLNVSRYCSES
ncbi:MAG TPA: stage V sporulation protein E [Clostridiales bacterium]|nr:stage V sporulation protein E [Clostridiales bacterium]